MPAPRVDAVGPELEPAVLRARAKPNTRVRHPELDAVASVKLCGQRVSHGPGALEVRLNAELSNDALGELFRAGSPSPGKRDYRAELEHSLCWISAHASGALVGFVNVAWNGGEHAFLLDLVVHPDWRRRGVGRALVGAAIGEARRAGLEVVHVDYAPELARFYQSCGFESISAGLLRLRAAPAISRAEQLPLPLDIAPFRAAWLEACRELLAGLPEWFAPSAVSAYAADLSRYPSWVATRADASGARLLGCLTLTAPQPSAFEVHLLAVEREHQRQGVGRALLAVAERFARRAGAGFLQLKTLGPSSPDAYYARSRAFYASCGYVPLFETDRLWESGEPALVLVKAL